MSNNNLGAIACVIIGVGSLCIALVFALLKEKAAILISGFNALPKGERLKYDRKRMSKDMRNSSLLWCIVLFAGAVLSYFFSFYFSIIAFVVWLFIFFREVKFDARKAFEKYKL